MSRRGHVYSWPLHGRSLSSAPPASRREFSHPADPQSAKFAWSVRPLFRGRSKGVRVAFDHIPCRSGWPSAVRGSVQDFAAVVVFAVDDFAWPAMGTGASNATAIMTARAPIEAINRRLISNLLFTCLAACEDAHT